MQSKGLSLECLGHRCLRAGRVRSSASYSLFWGHCSFDFCCWSMIASSKNLPSAQAVRVGLNMISWNCVLASSRKVLGATQESLNLKQRAPGNECLPSSCSSASKKPGRGCASNPSVSGYSLRSPTNCLHNQIFPRPVASRVPAGKS